MYEVRFKGRWSGSIERALADLDPTDDDGHTVVIVRDSPAFVALVNRTSDLGLEIDGVRRVDPGALEPAT